MEIVRSRVWCRIASAGMLLALLAATPGHAVVPEPVNGATPIMAPFADHVELKIEQPAAVVWAHLKRLYVDGERSRQYGYAVSPLNNAADAPFGGTLAQQPSKTERPQVRTRVASIDEGAMLLALVIDLENPAPIHVIHQVLPDGAAASRYQSIVQTLWPVKPEVGRTLDRNEVARRMRATIDEHNREMRAILEREKAVIEASGR